MGCHASALLEKVNHNAGQRGLPGAELNVSCRCGSIARKMPAMVRNLAAGAPGLACDLVESSGQSGRRFVGTCDHGRGKERPGMWFKGDVEHDLEIQVETFVDWELR